MFVVSVYDPYFDTHREECEYSYVFVLNTLSYLFSTTDEKLQEGSYVCTCSSFVYIPKFTIIIMPFADVVELKKGNVLSLVLKVNFIYAHDLAYVIL